MNLFRFMDLEQDAEPAEFSFLWQFAPRYFLRECVMVKFRPPHFIFAYIPLTALSFPFPRSLPHPRPPQADLPVLCDSLWAS